MMGKLEDLSGKRFGKLVVLYRSGTYKNRAPLWRCHCDCGNETDVRGQSLREGRTQSCGCKGKRLDLTGMTFGLLTALYVVGVSGSGNTIWRCACSCQDKTEIDVNSQNLISGNVRSCRCIKRLDLVGKTFGRLSVIRYAGLDKMQTSLWECRCECGTTKTIMGRSLVSGKTTSCGCYKSERLREYHTIHGLCGTPEYHRAQCNKRRELEKTQDCSWTVDMEQSLVAFFMECVVCGGIDRLATAHVYPLDLGYGLIPGNAVRLCVHCNSSQGNRTPENLPKTMPPDAGQKILASAELFKNHWYSLHPTEEDGDDTGTNGLLKQDSEQCIIEGTC